MKKITALVLLAMLVGISVQAASPFQLSNRIRVEYDDNIYESETDEQDSLKIIEEIGFQYDLNLEQTTISLHYQPSFVWWNDRESDDTDFHHSLDLVMKHRFSERVGVDLKETFRMADRPELMDRGATIRDNGDYLYNSLGGGMDFLISPKTFMDVEGRYLLLRYDDEDLSLLRDYDLYVGGLSLRREFSERNSSSLQLRYEDIAYEGPDRGSDSVQAGAQVDQTFNPKFLANARAGYQLKTYNDSVASDSSAPYFNVGMTFLPNPGTRLNLGVGYSLYEADLDDYTNQERTRLSAGVSHEVTAKLALHLIGYYTISSYDAEDVLTEEAGLHPDGDENIIQISARATYQVAKDNWLEAGWQYTDLDSELRSDFQRNRLNLGWKIRI